MILHSNLVERNRCQDNGHYILEAIVVLEQPANIAADDDAKFLKILRKMKILALVYLIKMIYKKYRLRCESSKKLFRDFSS